MAVDPVSPASSNSKEVSDEPAAPRRNSIDDNDPSRPRKRLAAMAIYDDADNTKQALPAKDEQVTREPENDPQQDQAMEHKSYNGMASKLDEALEAELASSPPTAQETNNKITIHLRTPRLTGLKGDELEKVPTNCDPNGRQAQPRSTTLEAHIGPDSLQDDSPTGSLCSPEIEVEEMEEMEEDDDLIGNVTIVDEYINNPIALGGAVRVKEIMDTVMVKLERGLSLQEGSWDCVLTDVGADPSPFRQLDELTSTMSSFVDAVGDEIESFYKLYLVNQDIWPNLPNLIDALMKRT